MSRKEIWGTTKTQARNAVYAGAISFTGIYTVLWVAPYTTPLMVGALRMVLLLTIVVPPLVLLVGAALCLGRDE